MFFEISVGVRRVWASVNWQTVCGGDDVVAGKHAGAAELPPRRTAVLVADTALPRERVWTSFHTADDATRQRHRRRDGRPAAPAGIIRRRTWTDERQRFIPPVSLQSLDLRITTSRTRHIICTDRVSGMVMQSVVSVCLFTLYF